MLCGHLYNICCAGTSTPTLHQRCHCTNSIHYTPHLLHTGPTPSHLLHQLYTTYQLCTNSALPDSTPALHQLYTNSTNSTQTLHQLYTHSTPTRHQLYTNSTPTPYQLCTNFALPDSTPTLPTLHQLHQLYTNAVTVPTPSSTLHTYSTPVLHRFNTTPAAPTLHHIPTLH